jgi:class 3 adenylate cyclase
LNNDDMLHARAAQLRNCNDMLRTRIEAAPKGVGMTVDIAAPDPACPNCGSRARMPGGRCADCAADLRGACPNCKSPALRLALFCSHCGAALAKAAAREVGGGNAERAISRRPVTVMFCDLVGSVALSAGMDAEDFSALLEDCHRVVTTIVGAHHGFVARYMGDGTLAYFGYPQSGEDDAERAVQAALAVLRALPEVTVDGQPMQARIGIATGVAVVGDIVAGRGSRGLDIAGDVPNLAARLQAAAGAGGLIDATTRRLVAERFEMLAIGAVDLKGWAAPVPAWQVLRAAAPAGHGGRPGNAKSPFVGREAEMSRLLAAWRATGAGPGAAVVVVGEMGIGKSRLAAEFLKTADAAPRLVRRWYGSRYLQGVALHPVVRDIETRAGIAPEDKQSERRQKLDSFLAGAPALDRALIIELIAPGIAAASVAGLSLNRRREMTLAALETFVRAESASTRLLAVFEDYHWADPSSRAWLALMVRGIASLNGLLIVTVRPGGEPEWINEPHVIRIDLDMLGAAQAARMVEQVAGGARLPAELAAEILARCDGVPLFLEEVTRAVLDEPATGAGKTALAPAMPLTIHASLISRLDSLGEARETAQAAAIIGREFGALLLAQVTGRSEQIIELELRQMLAAGLIHKAGDGAFRFKHALIQDAAYDSMLRQHRRALHGRLGAALRAFSPALAETQPQLLAIHFTEAGETEEAVSWWRAAAMRSLQQSAMTEGLAQLERGLDLLQALPDTETRRTLELDLLICQAKAHAATAGHASDKVESSLRRARELSRSLPGAPQLLTATFGQWAHYVTRGPLGEAARLSAEISDMAGASGNKVAALFSDYTTGTTQAIMGRFTGAAYILQQGIAACDGLDPAFYLAPATGDPKAVMRALLSMVETHQGRREASARSIGTALREAAETKMSYSIALALLVKVTNECFGGAPDNGFDDLDNLRDFAGRSGMEFFEAMETPLRGWMIARRGDTAAGLAMLRDGLERYRATQSRVWIYTFLRMQAEVLGWRGEVEAGLAVLDEAEAASASANTGFEDSIMARARGELLARAGKMKAARAAFGRAEQLAVAAGARLHAEQARAAQARWARAAATAE